MRGKVDVGFMLNMAEKRIMQGLMGRTLSKDTIQEFTAQAVGGEVAFPLEVQSVLAMDLNGHQIPVRSIFFEYLENGPGYSTLNSNTPAQWVSGTAHPMLVDQGDQDFAEGRRRVYKLVAPTSPDQTVTAVCKLRWLEKKPTDLMTVKNFEALRNMVQCIINEEAEQWDMATAAMSAAAGIIESENKEYLSGIRRTVHVQTIGFSDMATHGGTL
jgi:hypothetical protein